jgi:ATP-dependent helicase HrpA
VIARARSLEELRVRYGGKSRQEYAKQSQLVTGARRWDFGELPAQQEVSSAGRTQTGYPALADEGDAVGVRVFATPAEAAASHLHGSARLLGLALGRELKSLRRDLAVNVQAEMVYRNLRAHPLLRSELKAGRDLRDDLLDRLVMTVFLEGREALRSSAAFEARLAEHRAGLGLPAQEISRAVQLVLERLGRVLQALPGVSPAAAADVRAQLAWLVPAGFLLVTPWERLKEYPRYLHAIEQRISKLNLNPKRDAELMAEVAPLESRYRDRVRAERGLRPPEQDEFRWLLEELRVSLFAQQLKTRLPVSARRIADAWELRQKT